MSRSTAPRRRNGPAVQSLLSASEVSVGVVHLSVPGLADHAVNV